MTQEHEKPRPLSTPVQARALVPAFGILPALRLSGELTQSTDGSVVQRFAEELKGWIGRLASVSVTGWQTDVLETLIGSPREEKAGRGHHIELDLAFTASVSARRTSLWSLHLLPKETEAMTVTLRAPKISPMRKSNPDFQVSLSGSTGSGGHHEFPNYARSSDHHPDELTGLARAVAFFKGAVLGGYIGSQSSGVTALRGNWLAPDGPTYDTARFANAPELLSSISQQLAGFSGINRNLEAAPKEPLVIHKLIPHTGPTNGLRIIPCAAGCVGLQAELPGSKPLQALLDMRSGEVTVATGLSERGIAMVVERCAHPLDAIPFIKGVLEGFRVGRSRG